MAAVKEETTRKRKNRAAGEGTLYFDAKRKLWIGELMVGYRPDGKPDIRRKTSKSQAECRRKLDELKRRAASGSLGDAKAGRESVAAYLDWWLASIVGTMDADSLRRHRDGVKRITPLIGRHKLADFRPEHVVTMLATLRSMTYTRGTKGKARTLSPRSVRYVYVTLRKALDTALRNGSVPRNVARVIEAPTVPKVEVIAHKPEDMGRVLDVFDASTDRLAPLYTLAIYTGCRRGELLGLRKHLK